MKPANLDRLKSEITDLLMRERAGKVQGAEIRFRCVSHSPDDHPSADWNPEKGVWICRVCGGNGGAIDLAKQLGLPVAREDRRRTSSSSNGSASVGGGPGYPTVDAAATSMAQKLGGRVAGTWTYHLADGQEAFAVVRFGVPAKSNEGTVTERKEYRPFHQTPKGWRVGDPPALKGRLPLYNLPEILKDLRVVLVVEGEKCVAALGGLFMLATTSAHGAKSPQGSDWTPLAGRTVAVLPDNDGPGKEYALQVKEILEGLSPPARVYIANLPQVESLGEGADIADWIAAKRAKQEETGFTDQGVIVSELKVALQAAHDALPVKPAAVVVPVEEPLPEEKFEKFPVETLPQPLHQFVAEASAAIGCDASYVALPLLAAVAAAIGNTRRIRLKASWSEPAVIWAATVGESGSLKSPPFDAALRPLREWQSLAFARHREEVKRYEAALDRYEDERKNWRKGGSKGNSPEKPEKPQPKRIRVSDPTVEALAAIFQHAPRGLLLERDELAGWIASFDAYKAKSKGSDAPHYLEMHRAGPVTVDRKGAEGPIHVPHAALSVTGTIQPRTLARVLGEERFEDGFAARLLLAMPPARKKRWTENDISKAASDALGVLFERLFALDFASVAEEGPQPVLVNLSGEAKSAWIAFYNEHAEEAAGLNGDEAALWAKVEGYVPRFALIFRTVRDAFEGHQVGEVTGEEIRDAVTLARWFAAEARRIYCILRETDEERDRRRLLELIQRKGGRITARELRISERRFRNDAKGAREALEALVAAKLGKFVKTTGQGRPTEYFEVQGVNETTKPETLDSGRSPREKAFSGSPSEIRRFVDAPPGRNGNAERGPREEGRI